MYTYSKPASNEKKKRFYYYYYYSVFKVGTDVLPRMSNMFQGHDEFSNFSIDDNNNGRVGCVCLPAVNMRGNKERV